MPRHRTPSPELTAQDRQIVAGAALAMRAVADRHRNEKLRLAAELATDFVDTPPATPKLRVRKPKPSPGEPMYRDGKSAAAHDARELAHHPV